MSEKIKLDRIRIRYKGVFDWEELYSTFVGWFKQKQFDYTEEKNVKKPSTYGYRRELSCLGEREESAYVKYIVKVDIEGNDMEDAANKVKTNMMIIDITPTLELDWQEKWAKSFKKKARAFFHKYMLQGFIDDQKGKLSLETYKLHSLIKKVLGLEGT